MTDSNNFQYQIVGQDSQTKARAGVLQTAHGQIETPIFMPVGTVGSVKSVFQNHLLDIINTQIILGNAYHLFLRPGLETIEKAGGLHQFINYNKPMLTDSGGYQVFSLAKVRKIQEDGVRFTSHIDGTKHFFSPERVIEIQRILGADIIMPLDICLEADAEYSQVSEAMDMTLRWLSKSREKWTQYTEKYNYPQTLFPIVQGGLFEDLRKESCQRTIEVDDAKGYAIGGLSVGEEAQKMYDMCAVCCEHLPFNKPRYLMGVGMPQNILEAIALGVDMFDCVIPTRNGRNGMIFTSEGIINIRNQKWKHDFSVIDPMFQNTVLQGYSKSYLRHLFVAKEYLGYQIASLQNLCFYLWMIKEARKNIISNNFANWKNSFIEKTQQRL